MVLMIERVLLIGVGLCLGIAATFGGVPKATMELSLAPSAGGTSLISLTRSLDLIADLHRRLTDVIRITPAQ